MSVLKLRRDMVVADNEPAATPAVEISTPLPLRAIPESVSRQVVLQARPAEIIEPANDRRRPRRTKPRKTFLAKLKGWTTLAAALALIAAYPVMTLMASGVGDKVAPAVDHTQWTVAWAGGASQMLEGQYGQLGWAKDAPTWAPMARLTAKPAYQQALAGALGDFASLKMTETGAADPDLSAAGRLLSVASTGVQVRAARDALVNYDRRARRGAAADASSSHISDELKLVLGWAATSQGEIARAAERKGNAIDHDATVAVYAAKGRAMAAHLVLGTMQWPASREAETARNTALAAWKQAAEFHPILVLNGNPDGSIFGNHPTSMGFAIARAETATQDLLKAIAAAPAPPVPPLSNLANETVASVDLASAATAAR